MRAALITAAAVAGVVVLGALATAVVYLWSAMTLVVFMIQVIGGAS